jgi:hypothetical protein
MHTLSEVVTVRYIYSDHRGWYLLYNHSGEVMHSPDMSDAATHKHPDEVSGYTSHRVRITRTVQVIE